MNEIRIATKNPIPDQFVQPMVNCLMKYVLFVTGELPQMYAIDRRSARALAYFEASLRQLTEAGAFQEYTLLMGQTPRHPLRVLQIRFTELGYMVAGACEDDYVRLLSRSLAYIPFTLDKDPQKTFVFAGLNCDYNTKRVIQHYVLTVGPDTATSWQAGGVHRYLVRFRGFAESYEDLELE